MSYTTQQTEDVDYTEIRDIHIPITALTTCPDRRFALVNIQGCCECCPHFLGLWDVTPEDASFAEKYRVKCGMPQVREITMFKMGGD